MFVLYLELTRKIKKMSENKGNNQKVRRSRLATTTTKTGKLVRATAKCCRSSKIIENCKTNTKDVGCLFSSQINLEIENIFKGGRIGLLNFAITPSHELRASM